jgi:hypothetical protein
MITLQVQRDIRERHGVAIDIECSDGIRMIAIFFSSFQLAKEKLGEI